MSGDSGEPAERSLSDLTDEELHQEGLRGLGRIQALDPTNPNVDPDWLEETRRRTRDRLDAVTEERRRRRQARQRGSG